MADHHSRVCLFLHSQSVGHDGFWPMFSLNMNDMMRQFYHEGFHRYEAREWPRAQLCLRRCLRHLPYDGPTKYLLKTINAYTDPQHWLGYRPLPGGRFDDDAESDHDYTESDDSESGDD